MNPSKEWLRVCDSYAKLKGISYQKAQILAAVLFFRREVCDVPLEGDYDEFEALLHDLKPAKGRWVKAETKKKTQGVVRPDDDPTCYTFRQFWDDYQYKVGIQETMAIWRKLTEGDRELIKEHVPGYVLSTTTSKVKEPVFRPRRKGPDRYLNSKVWKDAAEPVQEKLAPALIAWIIDDLTIESSYPLIPDPILLHSAISPLVIETDAHRRKFHNIVREYYDKFPQFGGTLAKAVGTGDFLRMWKESGGELN